MNNPVSKLTQIQELIKAGFITKKEAWILLDMPDHIIVCKKCGNHTVDLLFPEMTCDEWIIKGIIE